jgi:hypothetical protein
MAELIIDYTVDKIIKEIISEIKKETGIDITYELAKSIIEQQEISTAQGIKDGNTVVRKYFGTFLVTKKRMNALNNKYLKAGCTPNLEDRGLYNFINTPNGLRVKLVSDLLYRENGNI